MTAVTFRVGAGPNDIFTQAVADSWVGTIIQVEIPAAPSIDFLRDLAPVRLPALVTKTVLVDGGRAIEVTVDMEQGERARPEANA